MSLKIGLVGLPNVGKSTLFNALTASSKAAAENFPFCTIEPNVALVPVPDPRLEALAQITSPEKIIPSTIELVDIAGLVAGASQGEGLGNQFLAHIRECQAIAHVVRFFAHDKVHHVSGKIDPLSDLETVLTELALADCQTLEKQVERQKKLSKTGDKSATKALALVEKLLSALQRGLLPEALDLNPEEQAISKPWQMLTAKPFLVVANVSDEAQFSAENLNPLQNKLGLKNPPPIVPMSVQTEAELSQLSAEESAQWRAELGVPVSGIEKLITAAFSLLKKQVFFTAGPQEVRSWTIPQGSLAPQAAGAIHTDFEKGFIRAEVVGYDDFVALGGESSAQQAGKLRSEGKDYQMQAGDVVHFRFNV